MNILIIDDDPAYTTFLAYELRKRGYFINKPISPLTNIIDQIHSNKPDFVLIDYYLPGNINGLQCAIDLKYHFNIPAIVISTKIPVTPSKPIEIMTEFSYFRKSDDIEYLDFMIKKTKIDLTSKSILIDSLTSYQKIIDESPFGIIVLDEKDTITDLNNYISNITCKEKSEVLELNFMSLLETYNFSIVDFDKKRDALNANTSYKLEFDKDKTIKYFNMFVKTYKLDTNFYKIIYLTENL